MEKSHKIRRQIQDENFRKILKLFRSSKKHQKKIQKSQKIKHSQEILRKALLITQTIPNDIIIFC
jgi:hypothetical protein